MAVNVKLYRKSVPSVKYESARPQIIDEMCWYGNGISTEKRKKENYTMADFLLKYKFATTITYLLVWLSEMRYSKRQMAENICKSVGLMAMYMMPKFRPMRAHKRHSPVYRRMADPNHNNPWFFPSTTVGSSGSRWDLVLLECCSCVRFSASDATTKFLSFVLDDSIQILDWKKVVNWFYSGKNSRVEHFFP